MSEISNDFRAKLQAKDPKFYGEGGMFNYENILNPIRQSNGMIISITCPKLTLIIMLTHVEHHHISVSQHNIQHRTEMKLSIC